MKTYMAEEIERYLGYARDVLSEHGQFGPNTAQTAIDIIAQLQAENARLLSACKAAQMTLDYAEGYLPYREGSVGANDLQKTRTLIAAALEGKQP